MMQEDESPLQAGTRQGAEEDVHNALARLVDSVNENPELKDSTKQGVQNMLMGVLHSFMCLRKLTFSTGWLWAN